MVTLREMVKKDQKIYLHLKNLNRELTKRVHGDV
jgi:hypothetical protein